MTKLEELSLDKIIEMKKEYFSKLLNNTINSVYASGSLELINGFENNLNKLCESVSHPGKLEETLAKEVKESFKEKNTISSEMYFQEKKNGRSHQEIMEKYGLTGSKWNHLAGAYRRMDKKKDTRPMINLFFYTKAKEEGLSNEEIQAKFKMKNSHQFAGFESQRKQRERRDPRPTLTPEDYTTVKGLGWDHKLIKKNYKCDDSFLESCRKAYEKLLKDVIK